MIDFEITNRKISQGLPLKITIVMEVDLGEKENRLTPTPMKFSKLVSSVFYSDIKDGLTLFVDCLQFTIEHQDLKTAQPYCVLGKDGIRIMLFQDKQLAQEHYPELRIEIENIEEVYAQISASHPQLLHPNLK
jgi:hypothetical protein